MPSSSTKVAKTAPTKGNATEAMNPEEDSEIEDTLHFVRLGLQPFLTVSLQELEKAYEDKLHAVEPEQMGNKGSSYEDLTDSYDYIREQLQRDKE